MGRPSDNTTNSKASIAAKYDRRCRKSIFQVNQVRETRSLVESGVRERDKNVGRQAILLVSRGSPSVEIDRHQDEIPCTRSDTKNGGFRSKLESRQIRVYSTVQRGVKM
jgi:hypothetical protein